jgi:hypothetical protein
MATEPESSSPCSQQSATDLYPDPTEFTPLANLPKTRPDPILTHPVANNTCMVSITDAQQPTLRPCLFLSVCYKRQCYCVLGFHVCKFLLFIIYCLKVLLERPM